MKLTAILNSLLLISSILLSHQIVAKENKIKLGVQSGPELSVAETVKQIAKQKYNLEIELVTFNDYVTPNAALENRLIDANAFQHEPFLTSQAKDRGWIDLVIVGNTFVYPIAAYSEKIKHISELPNNAKVAIPNDPTNMGRSLLLLQAQGLIELKDPINLTQTPLDVTKNPKNLNIQTLDVSLLARALSQVELAIINNTFASQENLFPSRDALFVEDKSSPYVNIIVAREDNKNDENIKNLVQSYQTEEVYKKAMLEFKDSIIKGW